MQQDELELSPVDILDANEQPICLGSILKNKKDGDIGVVKLIVREDTPNHQFAHLPAVGLGDLEITIGCGSSRVTNCCSEWEHVPRSLVSFYFRRLSWLYAPYEHDADRGISPAEGVAIEGIMTLLPEEVLDWHDDEPWPDSIITAMGFLERFLTDISEAKMGLQEKQAEDFLEEVKATQYRQRKDLQKAIETLTEKKDKK